MAAILAMSLNSQLTGNGLTFKGNVPATVVQLDAPPSVDQNLHNDAQNLSLLKTFAVSDQAVRDSDPDLEAVLSEIYRLDQKLNLIQALLTQLLLQHQVIPERCPIQLGLASLVVTLSSTEAFSVGDHVLAELFLVDEVPRALNFFGVVRGTENVGSERVVIDIELSGLSDAVDSLLGRFIFSQHRREVAMQRLINDEE